MNTSAAIGNLLKIVFVAACIYGLVTWQSTENQDSDIRSFVEKACIDGVRVRFNATRVRVISVEKSPKGYVVKTSITVPRGTTAKTYCVANRHGGVTDIYIEEQ